MYQPRNFEVFAKLLSMQIWIDKLQKKKEKTKNESVAITGKNHLFAVHCAPLITQNASASQYRGD